MNIGFYTNVFLLLMISGLAAHATYTDWKRFEIENYGVLFGTPIIWLTILTGWLERSVLHVKIGEFGLQVVESDLTIGVSLLSFFVIFAIFYIAPVGGGDMKFLAFIAAYFGILETMLVFLLGSLFMLIYHAVTAKSYIRKNPKLLEGIDGFWIKFMKVSRRKVPLFVGMGPGIIVASLFYIYTYITMI